MGILTSQRKGILGYPLTLFMFITGDVMNFLNIIIVVNR